MSLLRDVFKGVFPGQSRAPRPPETACPVCDGESHLLDHVEFNRNCLDIPEPASGIEVPYHWCPTCQFCFAPTIARWDRAEFEAKIYNAQYVRFDPDYRDARPRGTAAFLIDMVGDAAKTLRHLDYGSGSGVLADILRQRGWSSASYDPFVDSLSRLPDPADFDLISAIEVFEHVPAPRALMADLAMLLGDSGLVVFTTLLSDGNIVPGKPLEWRYAAPRNGHISLYSRRSLELLAAGHGLQFASFKSAPQLAHCMWRNASPWIAEILPYLSPEPAGNST